LLKNQYHQQTAGVPFYRIGRELIQLSRCVTPAQGDNGSFEGALQWAVWQVFSARRALKAIYGEPISAQGKSVIPVAKNNVWLRCRRGHGGMGNTSARGEGGGGGGGVRAVPVGVIELSNQQTRFIPITDRKKLAGAVLAGIGFGMWLGWRRRRCHYSVPTAFNRSP
jgi:Sporulation protein YtfJ (Spore_YtfJ)